MIVSPMHSPIPTDHPPAADEVQIEVDPRESILFLGSGFSRTATNILGTNIPTSRELHRSFADKLDVQPDDYDLKILADEIASQGNIDLYQLLYNTFTVRDIHEDQDAILRLPWNRIYTTNYDDAAEFACHRYGKTIHSFNHDEKKPQRLPSGSIIHLHGVIRKTTPENILDQLVLNEKSYVRQHFEVSPWYGDFIRDLRFCDACYFIGYNLSDYHISALLMKTPGVRAKTYFVTQQPVASLFVSRVSNYGVVLPLDTNAFAELCRTSSTPSIVTSPHATKGFQYLDPIKDRRTLSPPTANEILNLVTYGTFNQQRCFDCLPRSDYVVARSELAMNACERLKDTKCLLIHSRIGNGKSIFVHILAHILTQQGYRCFLARDNAPLLQRDVTILKTFRNLVIFFDSYNQAIDFIDQLTEVADDTRFVVSVRTSVQEVRLHEIQSRLPTPLDRVDLNRMTKRDADSFLELLVRAGAGTSNLRTIVARSKDFRDVVVGVYRNRLIQEKIERELSPLFSDRKAKLVFVVTHLLKWSGQEIDIAFVRSVTRCDAYAEVTKFRELAGDVFSLDSDEILVRSSVFAEYILQHVFTTSDIIDCIYSILVEAVKRKYERRYQAVLSSLMRVSEIIQVLQHDSNRIGAVRDLFERLRLDEALNEEPLFWLQYSILMSHDNDLRAAEGFIRTAYLRAESSPGFRTFQIDTYALRLFLSIEQKGEPTVRVARFDEIVDKMERIRLMIGEEGIRSHAIQVLKHVAPFVSTRIAAFSTGEKIALVQHCNLLIQELDLLSRDEQDRKEVRASRMSLLSGIQTILEFDAKLQGQTTR